MRRRRDSLGHEIEPLDWYFVDFIGEGRGNQALAKALVETERRVDVLSEEVEGPRRSRQKIFRSPPVEWIKDRLANLGQVLE